MSRAERREVAMVIIGALSGLKGDLSGKFFALSQMSPEDEQRLIEVRSCVCLVHDNNLYKLTCIVTLGGDQM